MMFVASFHTLSACAWSCGWIRDLISVVQKKALTLCGRERGKSFSSRFRKNVKGITEKRVGGGFLCQTRKEKEEARIENSLFCSPVRFLNCLCTAFRGYCWGKKERTKKVFLFLYNMVKILLCNSEICQREWVLQLR